MIKQRENGRWQPGSSFGGRSKQTRCMRCGKLVGRGTGVCKCPEPIPNTRHDEAGYQMQFWHETWTREVYRVLKPGAHLLAFGGTRTHHRLMCALEDAGFEIRDCLMWLYGSGFPKSHNLKGEWQGWGTALKPAYEPIILARKPLIGSVARNVTEYGTGGINVDGCRIGNGKDVPASPRRATQGPAYGDLSNDPGTGDGWNPNIGRWPANVLLDEEAAALLDAQSGERTSGWRDTDKRTMMLRGNVAPDASNGHHYGDTGGASRFFYTAKASRAERNRGLSGESNSHPTVKPLSLMQYLVRLITPPGGMVLDPFMGSGSTGIAAAREGASFLGIEQDPAYVEIAKRRMAGDAPLFTHIQED